jgi:eukaryotic-like serine/threonine-protein kinase
MIVGGKYKLVRLLGRGGMGEVHEATHKGTGRRVALKLLTNTSLPGDEEDSERHEEVIARFAREARAAGQINSPHVVEVLDAGVDDTTKQPFMVMEYLTGEDLQRVLKRTGPLPVQTALRITAQALSGLSRAHEAGVVHRDIKPANLFLARNDHGLTMKVVDFGIARVEGKNDGQGDITQDLTRTGSMLGSPTYMSPEQARGLRQIDARADLWSLGIVLYKMLTGRTPHERGDGGLGELLIAICCVPAPPVQDFAPWVPAEAAEVVQRALAIDVKHRFDSADQMLAAVMKLLPNGSVDLQQDEVLAGVSDNDKAIVAERADTPGYSATFRHMPSIPVTDGSTNDATRMTMSGDEFGLNPRKRTPTAWIGGAIATVVLVTAAGGLLWKSRVNASDAAHVAAALTSADALAKNAGLAVATPTAEVPRTVQIEVPSGCSAEVDGASTSIVNGQVTIEGGLGTPHKLRIQRGIQDKTFDISILVNGASLSKVDFDTVNKPAPQVFAGGKATVAATSSATAATRAPTATAAVATPASTGIAGVNRKFDEFK